MEKHITDEKTGISYTLHSDTVFIPKKRGSETEPRFLC